MLQNMFEDLFTTYSNVEVPRIKSNFLEPDAEPFTNQFYNQYIPSTPQSDDRLQSEEELFSFQEEMPEQIQYRPQLQRKELTLGQKVVDLARSFVGNPYVWGGKSPKQGFDCSGLISYVYKQNGINIPQSTFGLFKAGTEVSLNDADVGDIICTPGSGRSGKHVKMISKIENGQIYIIEAKGKNYGIVELPLDRTDNIITIRRITNNMTSNNIASNKSFEQAWNNVEKEDPSIGQYKDFFRRIAFIESSYNPKSHNNIAYGLFGILNTSKYPLVSMYAGTDINTFLNNPELQIKTAIKLLRNNDKQLTPSRLSRGANKGLSKDEMRAAAWFSGIGGLDAFLKGENRSDGNSTVMQYINKFRKV